MVWITLKLLWVWNLVGTTRLMGGQTSILWTTQCSFWYRAGGLTCPAFVAYIGCFFIWLVCFICRLVATNAPIIITKHMGLSKLSNKLETHNSDVAQYYFIVLFWCPQIVNIPLILKWVSVIFLLKHQHHHNFQICVLQWNYNFQAA